MLRFLSPQFRRLALLAAQDPRQPVMIWGERGTGRSELARWIHRNSLRATEPFTRCTAETLSLAPPQGSVLVENFDFLSTEEQSRILHLAETQSWVCPPSPPRLLGARVFLTGSVPHSCASLERLENWKYCFRIPPLRDRQEEFEGITQQLLDDLTLPMGRPTIRGLSPAALAQLKAEPWPGNLRELRDRLHAALNRAPRNQTVLQLEDLSPPQGAPGNTVP